MLHIIEVVTEAIIIATSTKLNNAFPLTLVPIFDLTTLFLSDGYTIYY